MMTVDWRCLCSRYRPRGVTPHRSGRIRQRVVFGKPNPAGVGMKSVSRPQDRKSRFLFYLITNTDIYNISFDILYVSLKMYLIISISPLPSWPLTVQISPVNLYIKFADINNTNNMDSAVHLLNSRIQDAQNFAIFYPFRNNNYLVLPVVYLTSTTSESFCGVIFKILESPNLKPLLID